MFQITSLHRWCKDGRLFKNRTIVAVRCELCTSCKLAHLNVSFSALNSFIIPNLSPLSRKCKQEIKVHRIISVWSSWRITCLYGEIIAHHYCATKRIRFVHFLASCNVFHYNTQSSLLVWGFSNVTNNKPVFKYFLSNTSKSKLPWRVPIFAHRWLFNHEFLFHHQTESVTFH